MSASAQPQQDGPPKWVALLQGKYPLRFVHMHVGNVYSVTHLDDATLFDTRTDAVIKARECGLLLAAFSVMPANEVPIHHRNEAPMHHSDATDAAQLYRNILAAQQRHREQQEEKSKTQIPNPNGANKRRGKKAQENLL